MRMMVLIAAATVGLYLMRSAWRMLVEIPDARQVWVPDLVDDFLSRSISAMLMLGSGLFLVAMGQSFG